MIGKLRKKIFWIIQISLSVIVLGVIIIFTSYNYKNTITSSTMFMDRVEKRVRIEDDGSAGELKEDAKNDRYTEGIHKLEIDNNNIISKSYDVTDEIENYAIKAVNSNFGEGYIGNYIYKVRKLGMNVKEVTLMESKSTINQLKATITVSIIIGILGLIIIAIIAKKIAKTIVEPVADSFVKQKQFVSDASHELKTPLAVIEANADVLQDKLGENKWITYIQNEVQSMNKLVNDLLTLARMENSVTTNNQKFNLSKEVQMSVSVFESMIYEKKLKLETNINDGIEFNGDKEDIKHIISILLDNAIKHTEENKKIIVNASKEKNVIKIEVINQGKAIPEDEREKIFERFYRIDKARSRTEKRYGLRSSYCQRDSRKI
ncbi:MAG: HAMP domain-containing histidine kinase [Clostridia bacterium]|nr:HAMP domain-containing histidine kinase [Clostridia bacterium]